VVIIGARFCPEQSTRINCLAAGRVFGEGRMFDHDRPPSSLITLLANDHQIHPTEGMDRQGDGHALRREVLTWCSLMGSSESGAQSSRSAPAAPAAGAWCRPPADGPARTAAARARSPSTAPAPAAAQEIAAQNWRFATRAAAGGPWRTGDARLLRRLFLMCRYTNR
jgi:hypothetical protein